MDKAKIGLILQIAGAALGVIVAIALVIETIGLHSQHPVQIALLAVGAVAYFVGQYLRKG